MSAISAALLDQEADRTGLSAPDIIEFALGVLAHCQHQTADGDLVLRRDRGEVPGFSFQSWAVPTAVGDLAVRSATRRFALEPQERLADQPRPVLRLIRSDDNPA